AAQLLLIESPQRTLLIDRMHDRPRQRKKDDAFAFEFETNVIALAVESDFSFREHERRAQLDKLVRLRIDDAKHERAAAAIRRDQRAAAEDDLRNRTRETREDDAGDDRESEQSDESFDRDDHIRGIVLRRDDAVADRGECVDAEEERRRETRRHRLMPKSRERVRTARDVTE